MSDDADLLSGGDDKSLPGYILSKPGLIEILDAERECARAYDDSVRRAVSLTPQAGGLSSGAQAILLSRAAEIYAESPFGYGLTNFYKWATTFTALPTLTKLSLRVKNTEIKTSEMAEIMAKAPDLYELRASVLDLWGFSGFKKKPATVSASAPDPSTGKQS